MTLRWSIIGTMSGNDGIVHLGGDLGSNIIAYVGLTDAVLQWVGNGNKTVLSYCVGLVIHLGIVQWV